MFIPKELDDAGLDVYEVRVMVNLARRCGKQGAWPSISKISKDCRIATNTVVRALKTLKARGFIQEEQRPGQTTVYWITDVTEWRADGEKSAGKTECSKGNPTHQMVGVEPHPQGGGGCDNLSDPTHQLGGYPTHQLGGDPTHRVGDEGTPRRYSNEVLAGGSDDPPTSLPPEPVPQHANKKPTRRNFAFDTLAQVDGTDTGSMTPPEASRIGKCLADIRAAWPVRLPEKPTLEQRETYEAALAEEIRRRAARYREVMPHAQLTACALVAHWGKCTPARTTGIGAPVPASGGRWALPAGCDWRGLARTLGIRIAFDTPWHEVGHAHRTAILEAHSRSTLVS